MIRSTLAPRALARGKKRASMLTSSSQALSWGPWQDPWWHLQKRPDPGCGLRIWTFKAIALQKGVFFPYIFVPFLSGLRDQGCESWVLPLQVDRFKHVKLESENDMLKTNKRVILSESIQHHVLSMLRIVHQHINTINLSYAKPKVKKGIEKRNRNGGYNKVYTTVCWKHEKEDISTI